MYSINATFVTSCYTTQVRDLDVIVPGADPRFQVGGGAHLKKIAPSGGRCEKIWGISCEKSRFYDKKSYFFQLRREARKFLGYFV